MAGKRRIPLTKPYFDKDELDEVRKVLDSGLVSRGPATRNFEDRVAEYLGVRHAVSVANCTSALHLALLGIGIKYGDEVLVADYTFPATGHAVLYCGAKPVFVDVDRRTYNMDPALLRSKITSRTKAVMPVHTFGQPAGMDGIMRIAKEHNLEVVEDAACAFGARYKNRFAGTIGTVGCFSLHGRKGITTGEGGIVVTNAKDIADRVRSLSAFGMTDAVNKPARGRFVVPEFSHLGYNYKMSGITAAVGIAQLKKLDMIIERKRELAEHWDKRLEGLGLIKPPYAAEHGAHIYQSYVALVDRRISRDKLIDGLRKRGIEAQIGTYASHLQPVYRSKDRCPNSCGIFKTAIALPVYYDLRKKDIDLAARILKKALEEMA